MSLDGSSRPLPCNEPRQAIRWDRPGPEAGFSSSVFPEGHGPLCSLWSLPIYGYRTVPPECPYLPCAVADGVQAYDSVRKEI